MQGNHLFKFGGDIRLQQNGFRDVQSRGLLNFSPFAYTGVALADLLLGLPLVTGGARVDNASTFAPIAITFSSTIVFVCVGM